VCVSAVVIIPARLGSTRFPEKVLASKTGRPLVQHVVDQVRQCQQVTRIIVAADDERVRAALLPFGTEVVMTRPSHPSGTDRVAEVVETLTGADLIVNVQGDEPQIEPQTVDRLIDHARRRQSKMATVVTAFKPGMNVADPNIVKAVLARDGSALYFSRAAIPHRRDTAGVAPIYFHHLGIYAYARDFLPEFARWSPTPLEQIEKLEQLRALEHGVRIDTIEVAAAAPGIDTPEQYDDFADAMMMMIYPTGFVF
jgi:3-deoxy-manno-octulosonate cytidylyltransferase (CMP-KDO synthetase)